MELSLHEFNAGDVTRERMFEQMQLQDKVLEIGPFDRPLMRGENIYYFDVLSTEDLRKRAGEIEGRFPEHVPSIDFVGANFEDARIETRFNAILSAHLVEHQANLIGHIEEVLKQLVTGGCYFAVLPDKAQCFDYFIPESLITEVLAAHFERRSRPGLRSIIEHRAFTDHKYFANPDKNPFQGILETTLEKIQGAVLEWQSGNYIDVHVWYFTKDSIYNILQFIRLSGLCSVTFNFAVRQRAQELEILIQRLN